MATFEVEQSALEDTPHHNPIQPNITIHWRVTISRDEAMAEGRGMLKKPGNRSHSQKTLKKEIAKWLDSRNVRVLSEEARGRLHLWSLTFRRQWLQWVKQSSEDVDTYSFSTDEELVCEVTTYATFQGRSLQDLTVIAEHTSGSLKNRLEGFGQNLANLLRAGDAHNSWSERLCKLVSNRHERHLDYKHQERL